MPRALFVSKNLIGDGLNISPALRAWHKQHQDWEIDMLTHPDHAACLYTHMGVPVQKVCPFEPNSVQASYEFKFDFNCSESFEVGHKFKCHQADAYARMLDVEIDNITPTYIPDEEPEWVATQPRMILFSPFSRSCSSHTGEPPNKTLPWPKWKHVLRYLRTLDLPIRVLGAPTDRAEELEFSEEEYVCGLSINRIALLMRDRAALLITIDNGMAHLGATQQVPTFELYPACLADFWIVPGNPNLIPAQLAPAEVSPVAVLWAVRQAVPKLLAMREHKS